MNPEKSSTVISNIERENASNKTNLAFNFREKLGLPLNASSEDVFAKLREQHHLPASTTNQQVIMSMLTDFASDLQEVNDELNEVRKTRSSLLGRITTFFVTLK